MDYQTAIREIFQPDFDLDARKYIHMKVAEKAYGLWKAYLARKEAMIKFKIMKNALAMMGEDQSKKLTKQKSKSSIKTKVSQEPKIDPESLEIATWNLNKIFQELKLGDAGVRRQFHTDRHIRHYLSIGLLENYVYRTGSPKFVVQ